MDIGRRGIMANRAGVNVASHNISNVNTPGASRQRVELETSTPIPAGKAVYGMGAQVGTVARITDDYLTKNIHAEQRKSGTYEEKSFQMNRLEDVFNEANSEGMNTLVTRLFNDFRKLSIEPDNAALRQTVRESAMSVVQDFNRLDKTLEDLKQGANQRIEAFVTEVNSLSEQVAELNKRIQEMTIRAGAPNDLLDQRELLLGKLAEISGAVYHMTDEGHAVVSLAGNQIVSNDRFSALSVANEESGYRVRFERSPEPDITDRITGGKIGGILEFRREALQPMRDQVNVMAHVLAREVNFIHRQGYGADGKTNRDFFSVGDEASKAAGTIRLAAEVSMSAQAIATALEPNRPGDNRLALSLANLQSEKLMDSGQKSFDDFYNGLISGMAVNVSKTRQLKEHQEVVNHQLQQMRENVSGISLDEETVNLIKFQHALDASSRVIKVADEIFESVLAIRR